MSEIILTDERYTPKRYIESARKVMGEIDLDPFSCKLANTRVKAKAFFSKENSAYDKAWIGKVFTNPPYSRGNLPKAITKAFEEYKIRNMTEGIILVPNWTERRWFQDLLMDHIPVCFTDHRIKYLDINLRILKNPEGGSCFLYFGVNTKRFLIEFSKYGTIINGSK